MRCHSCDSFIEYSYSVKVSPVISSDCRVIDRDLDIYECQQCGLIQKKTDNDWRSLCDDIYENYRIYYQALGAEQKTRDARKGGFESRSSLIIKYMHSIIKLKNSGNVLDLGCGNGALLRNFRVAFPNWKIFGTDLNDVFSEEILSISDASYFIRNEDLFNSGITFDVVTLIHSLEHIVSPSEYLLKLNKLLKIDGILVIQVPDIENNPFDLTIADHASHFSKSALMNIIEKAELDIIEVGNPISPNEITLVAKKCTAKKIKICQKPQFLLEDSRKFLDHAIEIVNSACAVNKISIFGSSIAATWVGSQLIGRVNFFIDEDLNRIGRSHLGKKIVSPADIQKGSIVYLALSPSLSNLVRDKFITKGWTILG